MSRLKGRRVRPRCQFIRLRLNEFDEGLSWRTWAKEKAWKSMKTEMPHHCQWPSRSILPHPQEHKWPLVFQSFPRTLPAAIRNVLFSHGRFRPKRLTFRSTGRRGSKALRLQTLKAKFCGSSALNRRASRLTWAPKLWKPTNNTFSQQFRASKCCLLRLQVLH